MANGPAHSILFISFQLALPNGRAEEIKKELTSIGPLCGVWMSWRIQQSKGSLMDLMECWMESNSNQTSCEWWNWFCFPFFWWVKGGWPPLAPPKGRERKQKPIDSWATRGAAGKTNNQSMKESRKRKRFIFLFELRDWNWFIVGYAGGAASTAEAPQLQQFRNCFRCWLPWSSLSFIDSINNTSINPWNQRKITFLQFHLLIVLLLTPSILLCE